MSEHRLMKPGGSAPPPLKKALMAFAALCWFWFSAVPTPSAALTFRNTSVGRITQSPGEIGGGGRDSAVKAVPFKPADCRIVYCFAATLPGEKFA